MEFRIENGQFQLKSTGLECFRIEKLQVVKISTKEKSSLGSGIHLFSTMQEKVFGFRTHCTLWARKDTSDRMNVLRQRNLPQQTRRFEYPAVHAKRKVRIGFCSCPLFFKRRA
jgi:hypothetical protein